MNSRQKEILEKLQKHEKVLIDEEARHFGVSSMTIRRDLKLFADRNLAVLIQGGAVLRSKSQNDLLFLNKSTDLQKRIASATLNLLEDCSPKTVMLSVGSTTLELARQLSKSSLQLTVVTNSLPIATVLFQTDTQVILTGGALRSDSMDLVGPITEKNLSEFHIDMLISGCDAADPKTGFYTNDLNLAAAEQKSVEASDQVVIITESRKFQERSFVKFASLEDVSMVVTDHQLSQEDRRVLEEKDLELICVE